MQYTTWKKTREGFYVLSGTLASPGPLLKLTDGKHSWTWADETTLNDQESMDTLLGKGITIDHHVDIVDPETVYQTAGNVFKVWWDDKKKEQCFSALITNVGLIKVLDDNPKMKIGASPTYWCERYEKIGDKIFQRKRYYNNLTLTFLTTAKNSKALVYTDSNKGKKMNNTELIQAMSQLLANAADAGTGEQDKAKGSDLSGYEQGFADGAKYNNTLVMADSLGLTIKPELTLNEAIFAVANHLSGNKLEPGKPVEYYDGIIAARKEGIKPHSDSLVINPDAVADSLAEKQLQAQKRLQEQRYPTAAKA